MNISLKGEINLFWIRSNNKFNGTVGDVLFLKILKKFIIFHYCLLML
jgi:hypothetical protein